MRRNPIVHGGINQRLNLDVASYVALSNYLTNAKDKHASRLNVQKSMRTLDQRENLNLYVSVAALHNGRFAVCPSQPTPDTYSLALIALSGVQHQAWGIPCGRTGKDIAFATRQI